jgi:hypothetical protein
VTDALDELDGHESHVLIETLETLLTDSYGLLKIFVSSRPEQRFEEGLTGGYWGKINVTKELTRDDMNSWIDRGLQKRKRIVVAERLEICRILKNAANGV